MAVDTMDEVEARLRETLGLVAAQTVVTADAPADDPLPTVAVLADHRAPSGRRRTRWWLSAAASLAVIALAAGVVMRNTGGSVDSATTSSSAPASAAATSKPPLLVATYVPAGFVAQEIVVGSGTPTNNEKTIRWSRATAAGTDQLRLQVSDPGQSDDTFPTPQIPYPPTPEAFSKTGLSAEGVARIWADVNGSAAELGHDETSIYYTWGLSNGVRLRATFAYAGMKPDEIGSSFPGFNAANEELLEFARTFKADSNSTFTIHGSQDPPFPTGFQSDRPVGATTGVETANSGDLIIHYSLVDGWVQRFSGPDGKEIRLIVTEGPLPDVTPRSGITEFGNEDGFHFVAAETLASGEPWNFNAVNGGRDDYTVRLEGNVPLAELIKMAKGLRRAAQSDPPATTITLPVPTTAVSPPAPSTAITPTTAGPVTTITIVSPHPVPPPTTWLPPTPSTTSGPPTSAPPWPTTSTSPPLTAPPTSYPYPVTTSSTSMPPTPSTTP